MNNKEVNCPFCGNIIEVDAARCPNCESLFKEPVLPNIKFKDFGVFAFLDILLRGWFAVFWFIINIRAINKLTTVAKDKLKLNWLVFFLILYITVYFVFVNKVSSLILSVAVFSIMYFFFAILTYRVLRIIQKYSQQTYDVKPEINLYYIFFFNVFYLIHFIDTYSDRIWQIHEHFELKWPHWIMLIIIFVIAPMTLLAFTPPLYVIWETFRALVKF